jgi:probable phosphoglycerate mutase
VTDNDLVEWAYGAYEGLTSAEIDAQRPGWTLWTDGCPQGERPADVGARADRLLMRASDAAGDVVVFSHGHLLRVVGARWIGLGPQHGRSLVLGTASMSVLGWEHASRALLRWNDTSRLLPLNLA